RLPAKFVQASTYWVACAEASAPMYSANDSLSHKSSHHCGVTKSPNHMCDISCKIVLVRAACWARVGVNDAISFAELHDVLVTCFDLPEEESPWHFYYVDEEAQRIDPKHHIAEFLWREGEVVEFTWGLWDFKLTVADIYPRDGGTPQALCVGGSGSFPGSKFNLTAINAALTGQAVIDEVLTHLTPPARSVIERSRLFDFVPLLQA